MKKHVLAAAVACGVTLASASQFVSAQIPLTLNIGYGQWMTDGGRELDDTGTPWTGLEWAFNDNWAAEVLYADDDARLEDGGGRADITTWQLGMLYYGGSYIGEPNRIRPYLAFGAGEIEIEGDDWDTVETTLNGGVGMRWMITPEFGLRAEARMLYSLDENYKDALFSVGINYFFGQTTAAAPAMAAVADGDEDGDGVPDSRDQCPGTPAGTRVDADGCPLPVAQVASIKLLVNFGFDSTKVEERHFADLGELAAFLKRFEDVYVDIEGHTDSTGPEDYNQMLSERRAQAVVDLLVNEHGIAPQRLEAKGFGESSPVADNSTSEGRAQNRRVMATLEVEYEE